MDNKSLLKTKLIESAAANILLLDSSEDEDVLELFGEVEDDLDFVSLLRYSYENIVPKNLHWFRSTLANYDDSRFKIMMRMNRNQFNLVTNQFKSHKKACLWITVCCILHNILLPIWDEEDFKFFSELQQQENYTDIDEQDGTIINDKLGELKRKALLNIIL